jgi:hypothetical protein
MRTSAAGAAMRRHSSVDSSIGDCGSASPTVMLFAQEAARFCMIRRIRQTHPQSAPAMLFKLFRKLSETPRLEQGSALSDHLARRMSAIDFKPSNGFLKDQRQPKRDKTPDGSA